MGEFSRRHFLKLMAVSAAGAVAYSGCTPFPSRNEFLTQSTALIPEDNVTGVDNWYATLCRGCRSGCGSIVRIDQGRALKAEGNPDYPVNRGSLCPRGQAVVQALYHPDRFRRPLRRTGERGSGQFQEISWDDARNELMTRLNGVAPGSGKSLLMITEPLPGHRALVVDRFAEAMGGQHLSFEPLPYVTEAAAVQRVFGQSQLPYFDIEHTRYLLSFGADFLGTWLSPMQYNKAYGQFRQGRPERGYFVQVEPRLSQTGANADEWLPIKPGTEGVLAMSIAQVLVANGLADSQIAQAMLGGAGADALDQFAPERVADVTGITADRIAEVANAFGSQKPALAIGGDQAAAHTNGLFNLSAIYALNALAGNVGQPGGVIFNPAAPFTDLNPQMGAPLRTWQQLGNQLRDAQSQVGLAIMHNANPVYGLPQSLGFAETLNRVPFIVSFSSFPDETTALSDLIIPDHVGLEAWGDESPQPAAGFQTIGMQQPLVDPLYDTRDFVDILLAAAQELGGDMQRALPWKEYRDVVRAAAQQLQNLRRGSVTGDDFEQFWTALLQKGGWWDDKATASALTPGGTGGPAPASLIPTQAQMPRFAGEEADYRFNLVVYRHISLHEGESAYLPWVQATPDPMTSASWQTWVEVNPATARELGVATGDVVSVESPNGKVEVPVYVYPAIPPDVVAMPLGQGHQSLGRWAKDRGVNPIAILAPMAQDETGGLAYGATRVRLARTGRKRRLPTYEGLSLTTELEPQQIVKIAAE